MTDPTYIKGLPIPRRLYHPESVRCGICDEEFEPGDARVTVDDERVHSACAEEAEAA